MRVVLAVCLVAFGIAFAACGDDDESSSSASSGAAANCEELPEGAVLDSGTIKFGSNIEAPPFEFIEDGEPVGFDIDLARALAERLCAEAEFQNFGFDGLIPALQAGKFDAIISGMFIIPEREEVVDFVPYYEAGGALLALAEFEGEIQTLDDICGYAVATQTGTTYSEELDKVAAECPSDSPADIELYPSSAEARAQVLKGTIDMMLTDTPIAAYTASQDERFRVVSPSFDPILEGIATNKENPALHEALQGALDELIDDGTYRETLEKWGLEAGDITKSELVPQT